MPQFTYFLPGHGVPDHTRLAAAGLGYAFPADTPATRRETTRGPGDAGGCIVSAPVPGEVGYFPDRQTWQTLPGLAYHVGIEPAAPPGPRDLERPYPLGFRSMLLGDGNHWRIPCALTWPKDAPTPLPKSRRLDDNGRIVRRVTPQYETLYLMADEVWDLCEHGTPIDPDREWEICAEALRTNYRIGRLEISMLGLLDDRNEIHNPVALIFYALVDRFSWPDFQDALASTASIGAQAPPPANAHG